MKRPCDHPSKMKVRARPQTWQGTPQTPASILDSIALLQPCFCSCQAKRMLLPCSRFAILLCFVLLATTVRHKLPFDDNLAAPLRMYHQPLDTLKFHDRIISERPF